MIQKSNDYNDLVETIRQLQERINHLENDIEHYFYMFLSFRASKKYIEEIVEIACVNYFNTTLKYIYTAYPRKRAGRPNSDCQESKLYEDCTGWIIAISMHILMKNTHGLKVGYPFYNNKKELKWRRVIEGALHPVTEQDKENRRTLLAILKIIKDLMKTHGVEDRRFDNITS